MIDLSQILEHQSAVQEIIEDIARDRNPAIPRQNIYFALSMLEAVIEEAVEARQLIKARKWWSDTQKIQENTTELMKNGPLRQALVEELTDIQIQLVNSLLYLGVNSGEFSEALEAKLAKNDPRNSDATIGNRS
jgi:NTP pyrophosphatase (non-canonical NTP hydrolase)